MQIISCTVILVACICLGHAEEGHVTSPQLATTCSLESRDAVLSLMSSEDSLSTIVTLYQCPRSDRVTVEVFDVSASPAVSVFVARAANCSEVASAVPEGATLLASVSLGPEMSGSVLSGPSDIRVSELPGRAVLVVQSDPSRVLCGEVMVL